MVWSLCQLNTLFNVCRYRRDVFPSSNHRKLQLKRKSGVWLSNPIPTYFNGNRDRMGWWDLDLLLFSYFCIKYTLVNVTKNKKMANKELYRAWIGITSCNSVNTLLFFFIKTPVQIKEFGAVSKVDFSPQPPYNYAVTASSRVNTTLNLFFFYIVYIYYWLWAIWWFYVFYHLDSHLWPILPRTYKNLFPI